jgi:hypothetical protein
VYSPLFGRAFSFLDRFRRPQLKALSRGQKKRRKHRFAFETCEDRSMLAATISGIKYNTVLPNGFSPGDVPLGGVTINLYQDNGDGIFNPAVDPLVQQQVTAPVTGAYTFTNVADGHFFINETVPAGFTQSAGPPFYTVDVINMTVFSAMTTNIDNFSDPNPAGSWFINVLNPDPYFRQDAGAGIIGGQRDLTIDVLGPSNPISANGFIGTFAINNGAFNFGTASSGAGSQGVLQYDGVDLDGNNAQALPNVNLLANGNTGIRLDFAFLQVGAGATMPLSISATGPLGTASFTTLVNQNPGAFSLYIPFAAFSTSGTFSFGDVASLQFTFNQTGVPDVDFQIDQIVAANQNNTGFNFGNFPIPGSLAGGKFVDGNQNGMHDPGEPPVAGVIITLTGTNDLGQPVNLQTQTAADGSYSFTSLRPGTYTLTETPPINFIIGAPHLGSLGGTIVTNVVMGNIVLTPGANGINYDFLEVGLTPPFVSKRSLIVPAIPDPLVAVYNTTPVTTAATTTTTAAKTTTVAKTTAAAKTTTTAKKTTTVVKTPAKTTTAKKTTTTVKKATTTSSKTPAKLPVAATKTTKKK